MLELNFATVLGLLALLAAVQLVLSGIWVPRVLEDGPGHSTRFQLLIIVFLFNSVWTLLFPMAILASAAVHDAAAGVGTVLWLLITAILWGVPAGFFRADLLRDNCSAQATLCYQTLIAIEVIGWAEMGLCILPFVLFFIGLVHFLTAGCNHATGH